jgi:hypothetical protein
MPDSPDTNTERMLQRWRDGHGRANAVELWQTARGVKVGEYAFTAVACDPTALDRLARELAEKLAGDAERYVDTLRGIVGPRSPTDTPAAAAMHAVANAVAAWRRRHEPPSGEAEGGLAAAEMPQFDQSDLLRAEAWKTVLKSYPQFGETTGAMALAAVVALGGRGLAKMREPWDAVMALGASRYIARAKRGDLLRPAPGLNDVHAALAGVQEYATTTGRSPWNVGYTGHAGAAAVQALRLACDAATCSDVAAGIGARVAAPGFQIWTEAEECHAFASMALDPSLVIAMPPEARHRMASAAVRRANALLAAPGGLATLNAVGFAPASLEAVMLAARDILPNGPEPRRWECRSVEALDKLGARYSVW